MQIQIPLVVTTVTGSMDDSVCVDKIHMILVNCITSVL